MDDCKTELRMLDQRVKMNSQALQDGISGHAKDASIALKDGLESSKLHQESAIEAIKKRLESDLERQGETLNNGMYEMKGLLKVSLWL